VAATSYLQAVEPLSILKKYWGFDAFRPVQEEIIQSVLEGKDTLALLPTGGGKSICFQVPALAKDGLCLVISPLIALMKDQVENLNKKNIPALSLHSGMSFLQVKKILQNAMHGNFKFLYVSPERLESRLFLEYLPALNVNLVAVDEAHCISQWGYDFRPPYLRIANLREQLDEVPILALTASATREVQDDICNNLRFSKPHHVFRKSFARPNLSYSAFNQSSKENKLINILKNVEGSGIVYCKSRKRTKQVADLLNMNNINADHYHAGLDAGTRVEKQENWIKNKTRIITCTNAFGMGIDKADVRVVVHYDVPDALESYYQEAGRAGRDEKKAYAVLLYQDDELKDLEKLPELRFPPFEEVRNVYRALVNYLQLPAGSGEGNYFDFDLNDFVKIFKLNIYTVNYSLKLLEQEGFISYNEYVFLPSTVVFTVDKSVLFDFEIANPDLEPVIKGLLRSYEGIYDFPAAINEKHLARFLKKEEDDLVVLLKKLQAMGIIEYQLQKDKPQLYFLQNRVLTDDLAINQVNVGLRKAALQKRIAAMIDYVAEAAKCRSQFIGNYFSDMEIPRCGICDNCLSEKKLEIGREEFESISGRILNAIVVSPLSTDQLFKSLNEVKKNKIRKVLNFLQSENKVSIDKGGNIHLV